MPRATVPVSPLHWPLRLGVFGALTVLLHLVALFWVSGIGLYRPPTTAPVVETVLLKPEPVKIERAAPPQKTVPRKPTPAPAIKAEPSTTAPTTLASAAQALQEADAKQSAATGTTGNGTPDSTGRSTSAATQGEASKGTFNLPPSADLIYEAFFNGQSNGEATIAWQTDGQNYNLLVNFLGKFSSRGSLDKFGLAPERYTEKPIYRRTEVATNFNRDARQTISFSRVTTILPLIDGAQDRFSSTFQLVSLVRANPDAFTVGSIRQFSIADDDHVEIWNIQMVKETTLSTSAGPVRAKHFVRLPRHDYDKRVLEIWLAEELGWFPAQIQVSLPEGVATATYLRGAPTGSQAAYKP